MVWFEVKKKTRNWSECSELVQTKALNQEEYSDNTDEFNLHFKVIDADRG